MTRFPIPTIKRNPPIGEPLRGRTAKWFPFHGSQQLGDPRGYRTRGEAHEQGLLCLVGQNTITSNEASYVPECICNDTDSYCPVHNGKGIEVEEPLTLVLTEEDATELYYAFRQRGECQTRRKVAEFIRKVEARNNRQPKGEWYAEPIITEVIRDIKLGSCKLSAIFSDGSEDGLFSFYMDELSFSDADLIGKTAKEAHQLRTQRDVEYLRS